MDEMDEPEIDESEIDEPESDEPVIELDHPRFRYAWVSLFTRRFAPNCMTHDCTVVATQLHEHDICCQYGCDIEPNEREAILARADQIRPLLHAEAQNEPWFVEEEEEEDEWDEEEEEETEDADAEEADEAAQASDVDDADDADDADEETAPSMVWRSAVWNDACIFRAHDARGCAIHRAALEQGWELRDIKPSICRLFPLSYDDETICLAEEYAEYSCAFVEGPTLYRLAREALGDVFGADLVRAMDAAEATVLAAQPKKLPVVQ